MKQIILFSILILLFTSCNILKNDPDFNDSEFKDYTNVSLNNSVEGDNIITVVEYQPRLNRTLTIGSHYVSSFTEAKVNNQIIFDYLKNIYGRYNIVAIQGIEDIDVVSRIAGQIDKKYVISDEVGEDFDKLNYAFFYDRDLTLEKTFIYDKGIIYYNPYIAIFSIGEYRFAVINMYTLDVDAQQEIMQIKNIVDYVKSTEEVDDIFIVGNLNADCEYYTEGVFLTDYNWLINSDTDARERNCVYSRIINTKKSNSLIKESGVDKYDYLNFEYDSLKSTISNQYLVWVELRI